MRERIEAYEELKYTALNCGIETDDIPFLVKYILADFEWKRELRSTLIEKKSRIWSVSIISQLSKINPKALEVLETNIFKIVWQKEEQARVEYDAFLLNLDTSAVSKGLLQKFIDDTSTKLLIIPLSPKFEQLSCVSIDHQWVASEYWIIERIAKVTKMFRENSTIFHATRWSFSIKEDTLLTRGQIEQEPVSTIQ